MSEEEKKAIEEVKSYIEWVKDRGTNTDKDIEIVLNLIDRLQKELDKKDKMIDLIIDDFQTEGYLKETTYEQVKKYYDNRNELKQEINRLPLNLDLTAE